MLSLQPLGTELERQYNSLCSSICHIGISADICFNTLRPRQNGRHFADDMFKRIFVNEIFEFPIKISLNFVPKGSINNIPALVKIMAWRRPGAKPYLNQWWLIYRRIYASLRLNELTHAEQNFSEKTWNYNRISHHSLMLKCHRLLRLTRKGDKNILIAHDIIAADDLVMQGARISIAMVLVWFAWNIPVIPLAGLTHWGRVMHIYVSELSCYLSDNGLLLVWRQAITWTNAEELSI